MSNYPQDNLFLKSIETSDGFKKFLRETEVVLFNQWADFIYSGALISYENLFKPFTKAKKKERDIPALKDLSENEMKLLTVSITEIANSKWKSVAKEGYNKKFAAYLHSVANKSGQDVLREIARLSNIPAPAFKLANEYYRQKLTSRVRALVKSVDATGKERMIKQLLLGIDKRETKTQLVDRLMKSGLEISKGRAQVIVRTETNAVAEYMRHETAKINGVKTKTWYTLDDEKTCALCGHMHEETVLMKDTFSEGYDMPPAHPNCRCFLDFNYSESACRNFVKSKTGSLDFKKQEAEDIEDTYSSSGAGYETNTCVNPNALWAGGNSLVGSDRSVNTFKGMLNQDFRINQSQVNALEAFSESGNLAVALQVGLTEDIVRVLSEARSKLSDEGYVQLLQSLNFKGKL